MMSKKRGVVISTTDHPITIPKSKSAHTNPLGKRPYPHPLEEGTMNYGTKSGAIESIAQHQLAQSKLQSQQPTRMVNNLYYTYDDPDLMNNDSNRVEQNDEYIIESMAKKKMMERQKQKERKEEVIKIELKRKQQKMMEFKDKQTKVKQMNRIASGKVNEIKVQSNRGQCNQNGHQRCNRPFCRGLENQNMDSQGMVVRRGLNTERLKPRPLDFRVDMLDKGKMSSPRTKRRSNAHSDFKLLPFQTNTQVPAADKSNQQMRQSNKQTGQRESLPNQNLNCHKMPFRFADME